MTKREVKLTTLVSVLRKLGFEERRSGSHGVFRHSQTGLLVTLPMARKDVPVVYLKAVLKQIIDRGIMSEDDLWSLLR
jgi:predicted RNA binding protein YcfA (HicA-like mRNA interferase family)